MLGYKQEEIKQMIQACYKVGNSGVQLNKTDRLLVETAGDLLDGLLTEGHVNA
jgi:hypothetical protein